MDPAAQGHRAKTDSLWSWNALANEYIVPIGSVGHLPTLGGSVSKLRHRGVIRFPSSVQQITFETDNISSENQGVRVAGWACWRVSDPAVAVSKLDFANQDAPMALTNEHLQRQCAGIMKGLISIKTMADLLKKREDLIVKLREKLTATEQKWGIAFDEIGISDVQVLSREVFENLQKPFRNEAREVASTSDLATQERIALKTNEQKEKLTRIEGESAAKQHEFQARAATESKKIEAEEEQSQLRMQQATEAVKLAEADKVARQAAQLEDQRRQQSEERQKAQALQGLANDAQVAQQRRDNAHAAQLSIVQRDQEVAAAQAQSSAIQAQRDHQLALTQVAAERALATEKDSLALASQTALLVLQAAERTALTAIDRQALELTRATDEVRLAAQATERQIRGTVSPAEIQQRLVEVLPLVAAQIKIGDVRWYGGTAAGESPLGILAGAVEQVLNVAEAHGLDVKALLPNKSPPADKT